MKNELKNGDTVIWDFDSKDYYFIGMSYSDLNVNNFGKNLNCVIEKNGVIGYANTEDLKLKPETVQHPGGEMPKPLGVEEVVNTDFIWLPMIHSEGVFAICYEDACVKHGIAKLGHAYATAEDAIGAGHVMFNIPKGE